MARCSYTPCNSCSWQLHERKTSKIHADPINLDGAALCFTSLQIILWCCTANGCRRAVCCVDVSASQLVSMNRSTLGGDLLHGVAALASASNLSALVQSILQAQVYYQLAASSSHCFKYADCQQAAGCISYCWRLLALYGVQGGCTGAKSGAEEPPEWYSDAAPAVQATVLQCWRPPTFGL